MGLSEQSATENGLSPDALQENSWHALLDSIAEGVWLIDRAGRARRANQRLAQYFGLDLARLCSGVPQAEIVEQFRERLKGPEAVAEEWRKLWEVPGETTWSKLEFVAPERRLLERYSRPVLGAAGEVLGRIEIFYDRTAERLVNEKSLHRERLVSAGLLLTGVAHELNNPLTAVSGYAQLMQEGQSQEEMRKAATQLHREAGRAIRIVRNLLLFVREDSGAKEPVSLSGLVDAALELRRYELKVGNIHVRQTLEKDLPPVRGNLHQLEQAILNLLLNAEQALKSRSGYGTIHFQLSRAEAGRVQLSISDDGPGVPSEHLAQVFEAFFTTKDPQQGTGLGLAITRAIVEEHGGEIRAENNAEGGATFRMFLPAAAGPVADRSTLPVARPVGIPRGRILVVDDEPTVASLIADVLQKDGCRVSTFTDSQAALAQALREAFELIICDIRMPGLNAPAFFHALCREKPEMAQRLLLTTGDTLARKTQAFLEDTQLPVLLKPFQVEELRAAVVNALARADRETHAASG